VPRYKHALTIDDRFLDDGFHGLIEDIEEGYTRRIAFVSPARVASPLPLYELALITAARAYDMGVTPLIPLVTPEQAPLAMLGPEVSAAMSDLLAQARIETLTSAYIEIPSNGRLAIHPGDRQLWVDRVVALPELYGPSVRGIPLAEHGFVRVDQHQRVPHLGPVYAAGDVTQFAIKHRALASQQADVAAESIAALAGARVTPEPFHPVMRGMLSTGDKPLYFSADVTAQPGFSSVLGDRPMWPHSANVPAKYLVPVLEAYDRGVAVKLEPSPRASLGRP
jgi:sulfide:quinone oxidoreductase